MRITFSRTRISAVGPDFALAAAESDADADADAEPGGEATGDADGAGDAVVEGSALSAAVGAASPIGPEGGASLCAKTARVKSSAHVNTSANTTFKRW
jgi:hypothetical protein